MPNAPDVEVTCICSTPGVIWVGTHGEGLIECTLATRSCRQLKVKDGLLLNTVTSLYPQKDVLWIGFGSQTGMSWQGGLGKLELATRRATAMMSHLDASAGPLPTPTINDSPKGPPRGLVVGIAEGISGELWVGVREKGLQRYQIAKDTWDTFQTGDSQNLVSSIAANREQSFAGCYDPSLNGEDSTRGGLTVHSFQSNSSQTLRVGQGLPANQVTALTLDGPILWVGGSGFVEALDIQQKKVLRRCYVSSRYVDALQVNSGILWVKVAENLYRVPISRGSP